MRKDLERERSEMLAEIGRLDGEPEAARETLRESQGRAEETGGKPNGRVKPKG
jgi:hypothetical protein